MTNDKLPVGQRAGRLIPQLAAKLKAEAQRTGMLHPSMTKPPQPRRQPALSDADERVACQLLVKSTDTDYEEILHYDTDAVPGVSVICANA
jgi:hypothetical protein